MEGPAPTFHAPDADVAQTDRRRNSNGGPIGPLTRTRAKKTKRLSDHLSPAMSCKPQPRVSGLTIPTANFEARLGTKAGGASSEFIEETLTSGVAAMVSVAGERLEGGRPAERLHHAGAHSPGRDKVKFYFCDFGLLRWRLSAILGILDRCGSTLLSPSGTSMFSPLSCLVCWSENTRLAVSRHLSVSKTMYGSAHNREKYRASSVDSRLDSQPTRGRNKRNIEE